MNDEDIQSMLRDLLTEPESAADWAALDGLKVATYSEAGMMTYDKGLVLTTPDGSEFRITIVQSR